jgi:hypothetical protein
MLTLNDLSKRVAEYQVGSILLDDLEDWFRDESRGAYCNDEISAVCASIEAAFSRYRFEGIDEDSLRRELAHVVRPLVIRYAENFSGDSRSLPTSEFNSKFAVNSACVAA